MKRRGVRDRVTTSRSLWPQKIGSKCPQCGSDAWGIEYRTKIVCRVCRPEVHGPRAWPRFATIEEKGGCPTIRFSDKARMKAGRRAVIFREPWGYRVVTKDGGLR